MFASLARIALCLLAVSCGGSSAQLPDDETPSPLTQDRIDRIRTIVAGQHRRQGYPAMAAGVIVNGHLAWQEGFGTLGEEAQPVTSQTVFRIGSITKVITSLAVLRLRDAGKLKLGDPAAHYLPELVDTLSQPGKPAITVRHLVTHSSGIPSLGNGQLDWTGGERDIGVGDILDALRGVEPEFPPGKRVKYSNLGMALAGLVVARTSGQQYRRYIEERFLRPLGMQSTVWDREAVPPERLAPGHWRRSGGYEPAGPHWKLGTLESIGGLYSTVEDMARFASFSLGHQVHVDGARQPVTVLRKESLQESQRPAFRKPGAMPQGIGWVIENHPELGRLVWHNGSTMDYGAWLGLLPDRDVGFVVLLASGDMRDMSELAALGKSVLEIAAGSRPARKTARPTTSPKTPKKVMDVVMGRVLWLFSSAEEKELREAFSPEFLEAKPPAELTGFFQAVGTESGECTTWKLTRDNGGGKFKARIRCKKEDIDADVTVRVTAPYLIDGLLIRPVAP